MVKHKIVDNIEYKYCNQCKEWKILDNFGKSAGTWDSKKPQCFLCINAWKKKCTYEGCDTYSVHGYLFCKTHGGGKKCILCDIPARCKSDYCVKHNPNICKHENCDKKPVDNTNYCTLHNEDYRCCYPDCINKKSANLKGLCKKHGEKQYCEVVGCNKIIKTGKMCDEHHCSGNIERCTRILITRTVKQDKEQCREIRGIRVVKKRTITRDNNLNAKYIVDLYNKNKNCHWCDNLLTLEVGGIFDLSKITIDRIDNNKGHMIDNVVLSCMFCNYGKNIYSSKKWKHVIDILNGKKHYIDFTSYKVDSQISRRLNAHLDEKTINTINNKWLHDQLKKQKWQCAITGLPIYCTNEQYFPWDISIDRINGTEQHTKSNCQITTRFINLGKNRMPDAEFKIWFKNRFPKCRIDMVIYPIEFFDKILSKDIDTYIEMISDKNIKVLFIKR